MNTKKKPKQKVLKSTKHSYAPKTNKKSNRLATKHRIKMLNETENFINEDMREKLFKRGGKVTHADLLVYHKRARERKLMLKQKKKKAEIVGKCSFKPKTIDYMGNGNKKSLDESQNNFENDLF